MPGTMTNLLREGGKYAPPPEKRMDSVLAEEEYWGRRSVFPGSRKVVNWKKEGLPLEECQGDVCPLAKNGINYAPFFSEGGEVFALNGRQSKPFATEAMWALSAWLSTLQTEDTPLAGTYRKSQLTNESVDKIAQQWNNTVMAQDVHDVLKEYFRDEEEGRSYLNGFPLYNYVLHNELHRNPFLQDINSGGLFNMEDPSKSLDPVKDKNEFDERYNLFIKGLQEGYDDANSMLGGALNQLILWRSALDLSPIKSKEEICQDLLDTDYYHKLSCINVVLSDPVSGVGGPLSGDGGATPSGEQGETSNGVDGNGDGNEDPDLESVQENSGDDGATHSGEASGVVNSDGDGKQDPNLESVQENTTSDDLVSRVGGMAGYHFWALFAALAAAATAL